MADPPNVHYGKEWTYGMPEAREKFRGMASPELWQLLADYKQSKGPVPDPGQDYLMKQRRSPEDEAYSRWYMGEMFNQWGQPFSASVLSTQSAQPTPAPTPSATPTILTQDELLRQLLNQKLKAQESEAERYP